LIGIVANGAMNYVKDIIAHIGLYGWPIFIIMNSIPEEYFNPEKGKVRSKQLQTMLEQPEYTFVRESVNFLRKYMNIQE
jgi:hypothetical protein